MQWRIQEWLTTAKRLRSQKIHTVHASRFEHLRCALQTPNAQVGMTDCTAGANQRVVMNRLQADERQQAVFHRSVMKEGLIDAGRRRTEPATRSRRLLSPRDLSANRGVFNHDSRRAPDVDCLTSAASY